MRRREFIALLGGGASIAWPLAARTQQPERMRRIGVLIGAGENEPESKRRVATLGQGLRELGWIDGRNVHFDYRFSGGDIERMRAYAAEVVDLAPDVIVVHSNPFLAALRQVNRIIPAVFAQIADPVGSGFVDSLARPGGNLTGFTNFEAEIGGKWLETLKQIAPKVSRAAVLLHPETAANVAFLRAAESVSSSLGVTVAGAGVHGAAEIERVITAFAGEPNGGLIVIPHVVTGVHRDLIAQLAARYGLPAVWPFRFFIDTNGGLMSYGIDVFDLFRRAAVYVDRILRGTKPSDLPVQNPTKYELVINLKTARALNLTVPPTLLARADEVIE
jgi:putative tryptophan/tyrosine transport system substrate-binding protein